MRYTRGNQNLGRESQYGIEWLTFVGTYRSGINTGAIRLHIYSAMHTQLDTTRIHIATSDLPM